MPTIAEFITTQFKKAGIAISAETEDILKKEELTKLNLPDLQVKEVNDKLMTEDVAKESPILKQHFRHVVLNPIDTEINEKYISEYEIPEELANSIRAEKNTYEKIALTTKIIKDLQAKKATAAVGDKAGLIKQIDELNASIVALKNQAKQERENLIAENQNKELNWNVRGSLSGFDYSDKYDNKNEAVELAIIKFNNQIREDGGRVVLDKLTGHPKLVLASDPEQAFLKDNQKITYNDYISKLVADAKMIKTSESESDKAAKAKAAADAAAAAGQNRNNNNQNNNNGNANNVGNMDIKTALKDFGINVQ